MNGSLTMIRQRRELAMVATEAAMQRETDPGRYARLERRNAMVATEVDSYWPPCPSAGHRAADMIWLEQVNDGRWTPAVDCLGLAPLACVTLCIAVLDGRGEVSNEISRLSLPVDGVQARWHSPLDAFVSLPSGGLELCALGGQALARISAHDVREPQPLSPAVRSAVESGRPPRGAGTLSEIDLAGSEGWVSTRIEARGTFYDCHLAAGDPHIIRMSTGARPPLAGGRTSMRHERTAASESALGGCAVG